LEPDITFQLFGRFDGPLNLRLILQPCVAAIFGYLDGTKDAKDGAPPYFWSGDQCSTTRTSGADQAWLGADRQGVHSCLCTRLRLPVCRPQIDAILPAIIVAAILAILPYLFLRGLINRVKSKG